MLKKIDRSKLFLEAHAPLFRCPICHEACEQTPAGLACGQGHRFDLSKKGTLYFLDRQINTDYDQTLFTHRAKMIQSGMYQPLLDCLKKYMQPHENVLDVGCGEGSFLNALAEQQPLNAAIGFDIAKDGIYLATNQPAPAFWCIADLTNLPFTDDAFQTILNIFSPSNYQEFDRILAPGGQVIKVVPRADYLRELRTAFYPDDQEKQHYSNQQVIDKFKASFASVQMETVRYVFAIPEEVRLSLLEMSPLEWGVSPERKQILRENPLTEITIDLDVLIGKFS